jgi:hypothetical protein
MAGSTEYAGRVTDRVMEGTAKANGYTTPWRATRIEK